MVLVHCTSSDHALYLYKVSQKHLKVFLSFVPSFKKIPYRVKSHRANTIFILKIIKELTSLKI